MTSDMTWREGGVRRCGGSSTLKDACRRVVPANTSNTPRSLPSLLHGTSLHDQIKAPNTTTMSGGNNSSSTTNVVRLRKKVTQGKPGHSSRPHSFAGTFNRDQEEVNTRTRLVFWPHAGLASRRSSLNEYEVRRLSHENSTSNTLQDSSQFSKFPISPSPSPRGSPLLKKRHPNNQSQEFDHSQEEVPEMTERLFKVIIIGDPTVGKTSFVQRYVQDSFRRDYKGTVGVDFALKILKWSDSETIKLQLWDIAGQERFTWMTRVYYKDAQGCIIMFDLTNRNSFLNTLKWKKDVDSKCTLDDGSPIPCMLLANKCDLPHRQVDQLEIERLYKDHNFTGWTETSAKEGLMVTDSMRFLVDVMMKQKEEGDNDTSDSSLRLTPTDSEPNKSCYC